MATYVLVHGAWHGGWCWRRVAERLRAAGHEVHTPTLTGLGERAHLLTHEVGLHTHVEDVVARSADGWTSPPCSAKRLGVTDPQDAAWIESRTTPMPLACFEERVRLGRPEAAALPRSYVFCTRWNFGDTAARCRAAGWDYHELDTGHDAMVTEPEGLAGILLSLS